MPALNLLLALASVAIVTLSSAPLPVNALVPDRAQVARHVHGHDAIARRKRDDSSSGTPSVCKPRPSSSLPPSTATSTPAYTPAPSTPAPSTTSSSAAPATTSPASSGSGKKWGLAWGADPALLQTFALPKVGYMYNWGPSIPSGIPSGIQGIPMLWGWNQVSQFQSTVVPGYANIVLGMNEPNEPSQSNMSPQDAVNMWMQYINYLKDHNYYLISPACTNDQAGLDWYQQFFSLCASAGCHVDAIAFHAYTPNAQDLIDYANTLHNTYNLPIWITEFADQNFSGTGGQATMDEVWGYASQVKSFVDNTPWIEGVFPFGVMSDLQGVNTDNALLGSNGLPTDLAYYYYS